jgi:hypothetical protein
MVALSVTVALAIFLLPLPSVAASAPTMMVAKQPWTAAHFATVNLAIFLLPLVLLNVVPLALTTMIALGQEMDASGASIKFAAAQAIPCVGIHVLLMQIARLQEMAVPIVTTDFARQSRLTGDVVFNAVALLDATEQSMVALIVTMGFAHPLPLLIDATFHAVFLLGAMVLPMVALTVIMDSVLQSPHR